MNEKILNAIRHFQTDFGLNLTENQIEELSDYYDLVLENNQFLHLVATCLPEEFAVRHILESLTLLEFLPKNAKFADLGTGAGLPSIPCLLVREDLRGVLIESKLKKTAFLQTAVSKLKLESRVELFNRQFEEIAKPPVDFITCRALDKFTQKLPKILKWSKGAGLLFFGGETLREELRKNRIKFEEKLMPESERRFLFISKN